VKPVGRPQPTSSWQENRAVPQPQFDDLYEELGHVSATVHRVVGHEPLAVDLSTEDSFSVVKVIVPGATVDIDRVLPNGGGSPYLCGLMGG
jgi:ribosomal protein S12 methylthiotransferase accessory factor